MGRMNVFEGRFFTLAFGLCLTFFLLIVSPVRAQRIGSIDPFGYSQKLFDDKMYEIAVATLKQFIEDNPTDGRCAEAQFRIGENYSAMGDYKRAYEEFRTFTTRYYSAPNIIEGFLKQGECLEKLGEFEKAAEAYYWGAKNFYRQQDVAFTFYLKAGELFFRTGSMEKAEMTFRQTAQLYPGTEGEYRANYYLAVLAWRKRQSREALRILEQVMERSKNADIKYMAAVKAGEYYSMLNDFSSAVRAFEGAAGFAAEESKEQAEAFYLLGLVQLKQGRGGEAVARLESASKMSGIPDSLRQRLLVAVGEAYAAAGDPVRAQEQLKSIEKQISLPSVRQLYYAAQGEAARGTGNFAGALSFYDRMLRLAVSQEIPPMEKINEILNKVIDLYNAQGGILSAAQFADKILIQSLKEQNAAYYVRVGGLYEKAGAYGAAGHVYETGYYKFPVSRYASELLYSLARCQEEQELYPLALNSYKRILTEFPGCDQQTDVRKKIEILDNFFVRSNSVSSDGSKLSIFTGLLGESGNAVSLNAEELFKIGRSYARQEKDHEMALAFYLKALSLSGGQAGGINAFFIAQSYDKLHEWSRYQGNTAMADDYRDKAIVMYENAISTRIKQPELDEAKLRFVELTIEKAGGLERSAPQAQSFYSELAQNSEFLYRDKAAYYVAVSLMQSKTGGFEQAVENIKNFLRIFPASPYRGELIYRTAEEYFYMNRKETALGYYEDYLREFPRGGYVPRVLYLSANCYRSAEDIGGAVNTLKRVRNEFSYSAYADSAAETLGDIYLQQQRTDLSLREYDNLLNSYRNRPGWNPEILDTRVESLAEKIIDVYRVNRDPGGAIFFLRNLLAFEPNGSLAEKMYFRLAQLYQKIGDKRQAIYAYLSVENYNMSGGQYVFLSYLASAELLTDLQDFNRAQEVIEKARGLAITPDEKAMLVSMEGTVMLRAGKLSQGQNAINELEKSYRSVSNYDSYRAKLSFELGKYHFYQKDYEDAERVLKDTYSRWEQTEYAPKAALYIGMSYRNTAKINEALEVLHGLARKYPDHPFTAEVYKAIGQLSFQIERYTAASASYRRAIEVAEAPDPEMYMLLISSYRATQMFDTEIKFRRDFIELFPNDSTVTDQKFQIGLAMVNLHAYRQAIEYFQDLLPEADINMETEIAFYLGESYRGLGLKELAIGEYLKVVNYDKSTQKLPWQSTALYFIGQIYGELGYDGKAIGYLKQIIAREGLGSSFGQQAQAEIEKIEQKVY